MLAITFGEDFFWNPPKIRRIMSRRKSAEKNIRLAGNPPKNHFSRPQMSEKFG
jgi:hypothetical protein